MQPANLYSVPIPEGKNDNALTHVMKTPDFTLSQLNFLPKEHYVRYRNPHSRAP